MLEYLSEYFCLICAILLLQNQRFVGMNTYWNFSASLCLKVVVFSLRWRSCVLRKASS